MSKIFDTKGKMFDETEINRRLSNIVNINSDISKLKEVEEYLLLKAEHYEFDLCYDLSAPEKPFFDYLNYSNYSNFFMMRPLSPELANKQIIDSLAFEEPFNYNYVSYFISKVKQNNANKYTDMESITYTNYDAVVCLPGSDKLFDYVCFNKLKLIVEIHGKRAIFKPHPLTCEESLKKLTKNLPKLARISKPKENIYSYIKEAKYVYTSHWSETVLYASVLGADVEPIDTFQHRYLATYEHLNSHLFGQVHVDKIINKIFNNYRSGFINPEIQTDWRYRIDKYLDYIASTRARFKTYYV